MGDDILNIIGYLLLCGLIFGIALGIYYKIKDNIIDPRKIANKEKAIANYKFDHFIKAISSLYPESECFLGNEKEILYKEKITNGVEVVGYFHYLIKDDYKTRQNSLGTVKLHHYTISVGFVMKPAIKYKIEDNSVSEVNLAYCKHTLQELKNKLVQTQLYIDAFDINKIV